MAVKLTYICDSCGSLVVSEDGIIEDREFTIENKETPGKKVCIQLSLCCVNMDEDTPVICSECLEKVVNNWANTGKNYIYYDKFNK